MDKVFRSGRHLGLLMARGGSKRIPRKNLKFFAGRPILLWPLETLLASGLFAKVVVSTEDEEIREVAMAGGAEAPFIRPAELADDHATTLQVIRHAVDFLAGRGERYSSVCCVYGTSVFLVREHLIRAQELLLDAEAVMAAVKFSHPVQRGFTILNSEARFPPKECMNARTQDLPAYYHDVGLFYWMQTAALAALRDTDAHICELRVKPLILSSDIVRDIDDPEDWEAAEGLFSGRKCDL